MKTIKDIENLINDLTASAVKQKRPLDKTTEKKVKNLRLLLLYLECKPKEETVIKEHDKLKRKIEIYESRFDEWRENNRTTLRGNSYNEIVAIYNKETNLPQLRFQLKNLISYYHNHVQRTYKYQSCRFNENQRFVAKSLL